jgi:hypothetical protein
VSACDLSLKRTTDTFECPRTINNICKKSQITKGLIYMGYSLCTLGSQRSDDGDHVLGCYVVLEIIYFMDFVHCLLSQNRRSRLFQVWFTTVGILQNYMVNSYRHFGMSVVPQFSGPNILDCSIMKIYYVTPKRRQLFTSRQWMTWQKAWIFKIYEVVTITAIKNAVLCDMTPCRMALRFVEPPAS